MNRLWDGRRGDILDLLDDEIPVEGEVTDPNRPRLEEYRIFCNAYYRFFNDGDGYKAKLSGLSQKYNVELWGNDDQGLEELGDKVIDAALIERIKVNESDS